MRHAPALAATLTVALVGLGPAAAADDREYSFPDTCDADDILAGTSECVDGAIEIAMHDDGSVTWTRETVYPRDAFEAYLADYEAWEGTLEEYLVDQLGEVENDVETSVTADQLSVTFTSELTPEDDAMLMGFALAEDGDLYAAIDISNVSGVSRVTLTAPGEIQETNGDIDGLTVTWGADLLAELDELDVRALTSDGSAGDSVLPAWLVPTGVGLLVALAVAGFLGFRRAPQRSTED